MVRIFFLIVMLIPSLGFATNYYVDFDAGDDTAAGTSTGTAWLNIPGTRQAGTPTSFITPENWATGISGSDTIYLKSGTTHDSGDGGIIEIDSAYYVTNATFGTPITFERDTGWGSGAVTVDGTGISNNGDGWSLWHFQVGGIRIDGKGTDGIVVQDSIEGGIHLYMTGSSPYGMTLIDLKFYNNNTNNIAETSQDADILLRADNVDGFLASNINMDGNGNYGNGIVLGGSGDRVFNATVKNCTAWSFAGVDDGGIGFKFQNSRVVADSLTSYGNFKGSDCGELPTGTAPIYYEFKNCTFYSNTWGMNFNNAPDYAYTTTYYIYNNLIYDNSMGGIDIYAEPYTAYIVHNTLDNNGYGSSADVEYRNIGVTTDSITPSYGAAVAYIYNNVFYKPGGGINWLTERWQETGNDSSYYSDYNSWIQRSSEDFAQFGYFSTSDKKTYSYGGTTGPGDSTLDWYTNYGTADTAPDTGLGHYNADANSYATGGDDTTHPPFTDVDNNDYTLTSAYAGSDISGASWYISGMGTDRDGNTRTNWDIGAFEYVQSVDIGTFGGTGSFQ